MLSSLGFDTVVVNNHSYDSQSISTLFSLLYPNGVSNFIFLSDFGFTQNSFSLESSKIHGFKNDLKAISPRGVHSKIFYNLSFERGCAFNPEFERIYALRKFNSLFIELPMFLDNEYASLATDINYALYRRKTFALISNFDALTETTSDSLWKKLLAVPNLAFGLDINFIFAPKNVDKIRALINNNCPILPTVSHHVSNYVGIMNEAEFFMETIGKQNYYYLCNRIRKCSEKFIC